MGYFNEDQLQKYLEKSINQKADEKIAQLRKEIDQIYNKGMKKIKEDVQIKKQLEMSRALKDVQVEYQDKINSIGFRYDESLIVERKKMVDSIFEEATSKLLIFTKTKSYENLMLSKLQASTTSYEELALIFHIKSSDKILEELITRRYKTNGKIVYSNEIKIGGYILTIADKKLEFDETIDQKLNDRMTWFYENSNLYIRK